MAAHTPGPWHVTKGMAPREIRADNGPFIASVYTLAVTYGERNANARLIAAAPALLAFLARVLPYCPVDVQDEGRALIAKAEGT